MIRFRHAVLAATLIGAVSGRAQDRLPVFHAAVFEPAMAALRPAVERELNVRLLTETGGSQQLLRRLTELKREADLVLLADGALFNLAPGTFAWRLDFAADEIVLGVGQRAPRTDEAEKDWKAVVRDPAVRLARADENLAPLGYRTRMVWKLAELQGAAGLHDQLLARAKPVVDDAGRLAALLKAGEADYAFIYRTSAVAHAIRFIPLDQAINLGAPDVDYAKAEITFTRSVGGREQKVVMKGAPIIYSLSIPRDAVHPAAARTLVHFLLEQGGREWDRAGFTRFKPRFFGSEADFAPWSAFAERKGDFPGGVKP